MTQLESAWTDAVRRFKESLVGDGLVPIRVPESLTTAWPPDPSPALAESRNSSWIPLDEVIGGLRVEHERLQRQGIPKVEAVASDVEKRLGQTLQEVDTLRAASAMLREDMLRDHAELRSVRDRLAALEEDLREHRDILTLQRVGSAEVDRLHEDCPVCHQALPASLLGTKLPARTLSPEETVDYISQQIELFTVMQRDGKRALDAKNERWAAMRSRLAEARSHVRALRSTLTSPNGTPSVETIASRLQIENRLTNLEAVSERFFELLAVLERLAAEGRGVRAALAELPKDKLSRHDQSKLALLEESFVQQLHRYDFGSFSDESLSISPDDYLPRREEFDLQADISASDSIRVVWAYLLGLMEVSAHEETNHPGLLLFDEPRQQSTKQVSFAALLRRAAADAAGRQVIFATSEELGSLSAMLRDVPHTLHSVDGYLLQPVVR